MILRNHQPNSGTKPTCPTWVAQKKTEKICCKYFGPEGVLINACVRYDKTKKANIGKRRNVYATTIDETYVDHPTACIDHVPDSPYGGIDLPPDEFYQLHALSSRHPLSPRPGQPSRPHFRPQSQHSGPTKPIRRYDGPICLPPQIYK